MFMLIDKAANGLPLLKFVFIIILISMNFNQLDSRSYCKLFDSTCSMVVVILKV